MFSKLLDFFWSLRKQFLKYAITGGSAFILDMGTLVLFKEIFHLRPVVAVIINQPIALIYVFLLNKFWTFKSSGKIHHQVIKFLALYAGNYLFAIIWMWLFSEKLGWHYLAIRMANIILAVSWNFLLYKYWIYRETPVNNRAFIPIDKII
ncbi:MAG: GtrA family protein [Candidatus Magasanikbacteria bacterium]